MKLENVVLCSPTSDLAFLIFTQWHGERCCLTAMLTEQLGARHGICLPRFGHTSLSTMPVTATMRATMPMIASGVKPMAFFIDIYICGWVGVGVCIYVLG